MLDASLAWWRRNVRWSNSRQAWEERIALILLALGAGGLVWFHAALSAMPLLLLWATLFLVLSLVLRRGWLKLLGPVLFFDLVRTARRTRYMLIRWSYAFVLMLLLFWLYLMWSVRSRGETLSANELAEFASSFFYMFMSVQFITVAVLTPAYTAGAIAEEKERKTLEFLLATDLRNREIVLSKLVSRICNLTLILLVGLPILSFLQFLGGVDPQLVLAGFAATGFTMVSLAALGIFNSVLLRKARDAITFTYLAGFVYLVLSLSAYLVIAVSPLGSDLVDVGLHAKGAWPGRWSVDVTVGDLVEWFSRGNIIVALIQFAQAQVINDILPETLRGYLIFHGVVALACAGWSVMRLRPVALKETYDTVQKLPLITRLVGRPAIGNQPMMWKEIWAEPRVRLNWFSRCIVAVLLIGSFVPSGFIIAEYVRKRDQVQQPLPTNVAPWMRLRTPRVVLAENMNIFTVRLIGTAVGCLMLLAVAVRAASSISGERDRQTLNELLTTPLSGDAILFAKWLGSILSVRWAWLWLLSLWALGIATGGLLPYAMPLVGLAWMVYAAVAAGLGLWFSTVCKTTLRATLWTILTGLALGVGHWVAMALVCYIPWNFATTSGHEMDLVRKVELGQTPPFVLGWLAFRGDEFEPSPYSGHSDDPAHFTIASVFGLMCWSALAGFLWLATSTRFQRLTNRTSSLRGDLQGLPRRGPRRPHSV